MTAELLELGTKPVAADAPGGVSARDEADFAALQGEVRKLELPDRPAVNWDLVVTNGSRILAGRSKDLLVAAYLTLALLERRGFPGFVDGLTILRDLVTHFWETLHPEVKRARGRLAAFEWLSERGAAAVARLGERPVPAAQVEACQERVRQISEVIAEKLEGGSTALSDLRSALNGVNVASAAPAPAAAAPAAAAPGASAAPAAAPAGPASVGDDAAAEQSLTEARRLLRMAGEYFRGRDPKDAVGYRLPRLAAWMALRQAPPAADGKTQVPPPQPADLLPRLEGMIANGQYAGVLQETEGRIGSAVMWLDLHRLSAQALDRMGPEYAAASAAVTAEVRSLLARLPGLEELRFSNDQPLAAPETRAWIRDVVKAGGGEAAAAAHAPAANGDDPHAAAREEAVALARAKKMPEALGRLAEEARRAPLRRDRVRLEIEAARLCLEHGHPDAALIQLERLDEDVQDGGLETWDPELASELLRHLIACRQRLGAKTPDDATRMRVLLQRLARVNVVATLELSAKR